MSDQIIKLKQKILPILKKNGVVKSAIFGSYARGEARSDSDIDLLVELPEGSSLLDHVHLKLELEDHLGKKVDVVTPGGINFRLRPYIERDLIYIL